MHHNTPCPLPRAALEATERGWHVFPLIPDSKRPAIRSWEPRATTDADRVTRCWTAGDYNLGIAAGPSGLVVVDLDVPKHDQDVPPAETPSYVADGSDMFAVLAERHGQTLPIQTYSVRTASGGTHLYFAAPADVELRNTAGTLGWKIDTRASGGYVVGAHSSVDGKPYSVVHDVPPVPLPNWLTKLLVPAPLPPRGPVAVALIAKDRHSAYLRAAVDGELQRVTRAHRGNRNNSLYEASVALGQLVAGGELAASEVSDWLTEAAVRIGLTEPDARRTIASGQRAGAKKPRTVVRRAA
ncbi:bifunctional DNA primase/polymerase [Streptomyces sp. NBC_01142]|uniref:bifunctional DNA primase/polymerase n=1 Tax=Streptomyces sp. NBC_01142 TaxID=2975865 RepID=UPI0022500607|nr:bifunctional DNA primase/polymerase [Streptomyces sp. NBC_01142]MCX4824400.1 bifunctional DNA primase/polymerase [Streptomyces sp. NBC_01142]